MTCGPLFISCTSARKCRARTNEDKTMKKSISERVGDCIRPTVEALGYRIWDVTFGKVGADYHLEITIDSDRGITIEDCEKVHRAIDPILDEQDPIEGFYYLEVSSPGLERELRTGEHFARSIGQAVEAKLYSPKDGRKTLTGKLLSFDGETITILEDGRAIPLGKNEVAKVNTLYDEQAEAEDIRAAKEEESEAPSGENTAE